MVITLADWQFKVDIQATMDYTMKCSLDHCLCAYCRNYYEAVDKAYPYLRGFLNRFGVLLDGPCEIMPLQPDLVMACYRITGEILRHGDAAMHADGVPIHMEPSENGTFLLWVGEMQLPWLQTEAPEDVISPANQPEFLSRMAEKWAQLNNCEIIIS